MPLDYWDRPPRRWCENPMCTREHWVGHGVCWLNPGQIQAEAVRRERRHLRDEAARAFLAGFWGMAPVMVVVIVLLYWTGVLG